MKDVVVQVDEAEGPNADKDQFVDTDTETHYTGSYYAVEDSVDEEVRLDTYNHTVQPLSHEAEVEGDNQNDQSDYLKKLVEHPGYKQAEAEEDTDIQPANNP